MPNLLIQGNLKVGKDVWVFNLPREITCTPTDFCRQHCYCLKAERQYGDVIRNSNNNHLEESKKNSFVEKIVAEIVAKKSPIRYIRIHSSGDFYSNEYIDKWITIAKATPTIKYLAFTKRIDLKEKILELASLPNVNVFESTDISKPDQAIPELCSGFTNPDPERQLESLEFLCPGTKVGCSNCNYWCWNKSKINVVFNLH